jgi:hypothetical protein
MPGDSVKVQHTTLVPGLPWDYRHTICTVPLPAVCNTITLLRSASNSPHQLTWLQLVQMVEPHTGRQLQGASPLSNATDMSDQLQDQGRAMAANAVSCW